MRSSCVRPTGSGPLKKIDLGEPPSFFYSPRWSPDSKKLLLTDKRLNLWLIDAAHPVPVKIDTNRSDQASFDPTWAPDSEWIVYVKEGENHLDAVYVYSLRDKSIHQVTDGRSEAFAPRFDPSGKYLWFLASTDVGLAAGGRG